jgi:hypothetical protein
MYGDACLFLQEFVYGGQPDFSMPRCYAYSGGVMKRGLAAAVSDWLDAAQRVGDRQLRGQFMAGHLYEGLGWSIPSDAFNYSSVACTIANGCDLSRSFARPADGSPLAPTHLSDLSYAGDWAPNSVPGQPGGPPNGSVPNLIANEQALPTMVRVQEADALYISPALYALAGLYDEEATSVIDAFLSFLVLFPSIFMGAYLVMLLVSFIPNVRRSNADLVQKRALLLSLPPVVIARTPALASLIDEILVTDAEMGGGGSVGMHPSLLASPRDGGAGRDGGSGSDSDSGQ